MPFVLVFFPEKKSKNSILNGGATFSVQFYGRRRCLLSKPTARDQKMKPVITLLHYCQRRKLKREKEKIKR